MATCVDFVKKHPKVPITRADGGRTYWKIVSRSKRRGNPRKWVLSDGKGNYGYDGCSYMADMWDDIAEVKKVINLIRPLFPTRNLSIIETDGFSLLGEMDETKSPPALVRYGVV